jgi:tetratricopeptide (TPR) repeat protein
MDFFWKIRPFCALLLLLLAGGCATTAPRHSGPASAVPTPTSIPHRDNRGAGALLLVLAQLGRTTDVAVLERALDKLERFGLPHEDALAAVARSEGLWAHSQYGRLDRLAERLEAGIPMLVQLQDSPEKAESRYFAVVDRYDEKARVMQVRTGDGLPVTFPEGEFWRRWERVRFWMMTIGPPMSGTWTLSALEHVSRMQFYDALGLYDRADDDAARALLLEGRNADLCIAVAVRERARGRPAAAEDLLRRALKNDDGFVRAANNLAYLLAEQGRDLAEAEQFAHAAVLREPTNPRLLDTLGFVLQAQGRWAEALPLFERAYLRSRTMGVAIRRELGLHLAAAYAYLDRRAEGARVIQELLDREPGLLLPPTLAALVSP